MSSNTVAPALDIDTMMAAARDATGLKDFGDLEFMPRAQEYLAHALSDGRLSAAGLATLQHLITSSLIHRLRYADDVKRHPEILDEQVRAPVFVTGMPRTGTTKLHRVMSCDPQVQSLPFWIVLNMAPFPGADPSQPDPRIAIAEAALAQSTQRFPELQAAHPAIADEPEEECYWLEEDFRSIINCMRVRTPAYLRSIMETPDFESHRFLRKVLQYVQWQRGKEHGRRPWVLKTPAHFGNLRSLLQVFPDATVIHTYRNPEVAMGSICSIQALFLSMGSDAVDPAEVGAEHTFFWTRMAERHMEARQDPAIDARVIDVHYDEICADAIGLVREIYLRRGVPLSAVAEQAMRAYEASHPQHQFGRHRYTLEQYGLTPDKIRAEFGAYIQRFDEAFLMRRAV